MRIHVVGGGPAGLYFALLARLRDPAREVHVWEQNPRGTTHGWGVVLSGQTLASLAAADPISHRAIMAGTVLWENVDVVHAGRKLSVWGNSFSATPRAALVAALQARCDALGVQSHHGERWEAVTETALGGADLVVGADGRGSAVRAALGDALAPVLDRRPNRYIWLATERRFEGLTLIFRRTELGPLCAHAYRYCADRSTFIVECTADTFRAAGLDRLSPEQTLNALARAFADDLRGHTLLPSPVGWDQFWVVSCGRWFTAGSNVTLLGDALHTAHFSIGSGTKLAMETALGLCDALDLNQACSELKQPEEQSAHATPHQVVLVAWNQFVHNVTPRVSFEVGATPLTEALCLRRDRVCVQQRRTSRSRKKTCCHGFHDNRR